MTIEHFREKFEAYKKLKKEEQDNYELAFCEKCFQMTNHLTICQKCGTSSKISERADHAKPTEDA